MVITLHRRENFIKLPEIFNQINNLASLHPELQFVFPVHPNPAVSDHVKILSNSNINKIQPLKYRSFLDLLQRCRCIITDSGGIQEEAGFFKKRVLICRDNTERPEGIEAGFCKLVGTNIETNFEWAINESLLEFINPYGDGTASDKIIESMLISCHNYSIIQ